MPEHKYRIVFHNDDDNRVLYDADDIPLPPSGAQVTFPSGNVFRVVDKPPAFHIVEMPGLHTISVWATQVRGEDE